MFKKESEIEILLQRHDELQNKHRYETCNLKRCFDISDIHKTCWTPLSQMLSRQRPATLVSQIMDTF